MKNFRFNQSCPTMKKMMATLIPLLFCALIMQAQTAVNVVPDGFYASTGGESRTLFPNTFANSKVQMPLYSDVLSNVGLTAGTEIVGIQWEVSVDNTPAMSVYDIAMNNTYSGGIIAAGSNVPFLNVPFTTVATGAEDPGQYTGTHTMMFDTPFTWDGTNHLVMQVCRTSAGQGATDETLNSYMSSRASIITHYNSDCTETISYYGDRYGTVITFLVNIPAPTCDAPSALAASNITDTEAYLSWTENGTATTWDIEIGATGYTQGTGTIVNGITSNPYYQTGFTAGTSYDYYVRANCNGLESDWVGPYSFMTLQTISDVTFSVDMNDYVAGGGSTAGGVYVSGIFNAWSGTANLMTDGNGDGIWETTIAIADGTTEYKFTINNWASQENFVGGESCTVTTDGFINRELVVLGDTILPEVCWESCSDCVLPPCDAPASVLAEATSSSNVLFSWDAVPDADLYQVKYRKQGMTTWSQFATTHTQRNQSGLQLNQTYQYKVRARCSSGVWSAYTPGVNFANVYTTFDCDAATGVSSIYLDNTRFKVRWDAAGEVKAKIRYREVGTSTWLTKNSAPGKNYIYIPGLTPDANYEYRVRMNCTGNEWSAYDALYYHNLNGNVTRVSQELAGVRVYPNPVHDVLNITYDNELGVEATVEVFDILGRAIISEISNDSRVELNVNQLTKGSYVVSIMVDGKQSIQKFVKH